MFHNREQELAVLSELWATPRAQLAVVYGRRRVGKTELLRQFCSGKRAVYFVATQAKDNDNLRALCRVLREEISAPLLEENVSPSWEAVLELLAKQAKRTRLVVVFDEFQYLCRDRPELPSLFQKFWDGPGRAGKLFMVLCGSHISFMEDQVLAERAPLFGRRTAQLLLRPLSYRDAGLFHPSGSAEDKIALYGVFGGLPGYLAHWERSLSLRQNVLAAILRPGAPLYDEVSFLLRTELGQPHTYASVLAAIAGGARRSSQIAQRCGLRDVSVGRYLQVLQDLHLVARETPATERQPERSKKGRYAITDPFLRFWFRFVMPYQSLVEIGQGARVYDSLIAPQLESYLGNTFESVCRQFLQSGAEPDWALCTRVGRQWGEGPEIDLVTENVDGSHYVCECKWTRKAVGLNVLDRLREASDSLPAAYAEDRQFVIFARRGFTKALRARAAAEGVRLVTAAELLRRP